MRIPIDPVAAWLATLAGLVGAGIGVGVAAVVLTVRAVRRAAR